MKAFGKYRRGIAHTVIGTALTLATGSLAAAGATAPEARQSTAQGLLSADDAWWNAAACYPFEQTAPVDPDKEVFAWYFPPYPLSIHNESPDRNWYERWLDPDGGGGEYSDTGGHLRDRPLPVPQRPPGVDWRKVNFELEIRQAIAIGLSGFILEMSHVLKHRDDRFNRVRHMLDAAQAVDPSFRILLGPGFPKEPDATPDELVNTLRTYIHHPSVFRLGDGRVVLTTFYPERTASRGGKPISWWNQVFDMLRQDYEILEDGERITMPGVEVAWYPMFLSRIEMNRLPDLDAWYRSIEGYSRWDGRWVTQAGSNISEQEEAIANGVKWMPRAVFQDMRVRKAERPELRHWESSNSESFRAHLEAAIGSGADWLAFITWNDYAETQIAPSRARGYAVADLAAYYTSWFRTGQLPAITRDALYYFHRKQHTEAPYDPDRQTAGAYVIPAGPAARNEVELLAFLAEPGQLAIRQGSDARTMEAGAGLASFKVPLVEGTRPRFELWRDGQLVESLDGRVPIETVVEYQDMTYYAGGGLECERPLPLE